MKKISTIVGLLLLVILIITEMFLLSGCSFETPTETKSAQEIGQQKTEDAVKNLIENDTLPQMSESLDREALKRRATFLNQKDRISYLYLLTENGQLIREEQVLGKVTSLNSYLTPMEQVQWFKGIDVGESYGDVAIVTQAPDIDGTYGENVDGIFWFDPAGNYREWIGLYLFSSNRMTFTSPPILVEATK